jgi:hypothetical protein
MYSVTFDVDPKLEQWDGYLGNAKMLRPDYPAAEHYELEHDVGNDD